MGHILAKILFSSLAWCVGKFLLSKRKPDSIFAAHTASRKRYPVLLADPSTWDDNVRGSWQDQEHESRLLLPGSWLSEDRPYTERLLRPAIAAGRYAGASATRFAKMGKKGLKTVRVPADRRRFGQPGRNKNCKCNSV